MSNKRKFAFPLSVLIREADGLYDALIDPDYASAMAARLDDPTKTPPVIFRTVFETARAAVTTELHAQGGKTGEAGDLTDDQKTALAEVERLASAARDSAHRAFPGDPVKLHSEFQVGIHTPQGIHAILTRAGNTLAAARKYAADLRTTGWIPADADALEAALASLSGVAFEQDETLADRKQSTAALTRAANTLYDLALRIQNAANLQYPAKPGNEAARTRFKIDTFPPRDRSHPEGGEQPPGNTSSNPPAS